jgi:tetratricopeptide (TPR) repeat protein
VFANGWNVEAAEAVCRCEGEEAADLLGRLVDKCLVEMHDDSGRYRMLETVRQYAAQRLEEAGEAAARERHLDYYAGLADQAKAGMMSFDQSAWLARIDDERENIVAAHAYAGELEVLHARGLKLVSSLKLYWVNRGLLELGHRLVLEALTRSGAAERNFARCKGLFDLGQLRYVMGAYGAARVALQEGLDIATELGDDRAAAKLLQPLGQALLGEGNLAGAHDYLERAYLAAKDADDPRGLAAAATLLGQLRRIQDRDAQAMQLFETAIAIARVQGDQESIAIGQVNRAMVAIVQSQVETAAAALSEALDIVKRLDARRLAFITLEVVAAFQASRGRWEDAALLFTVAARHSREAGIRREPTDEKFLERWIGMVPQPQRLIDDAAGNRGESLSLGEAIGLASGIVTSRR